MRNKSEKGVTLIALTITIVVLLILTSIIITNGTKQLGLKKVNNMEVDIESISSKITDYYLKNESLPVFERGYFSNKEEFNAFLTQKNITKVEDIINPNDEGYYYVIDLSKLEGLTLNYGEKYKDWLDESKTNTNFQDIYIINETSHQIYFPQGIKYNKEYYFTTPITSEEVNAVTIESEVGEWNFEVLNNPEQDSVDRNFITLTANVKLNLNTNYKKDSLEYVWTTENDENAIQNIAFSKFTLNENDSATIKSKNIDNTLHEVYLWVKVLDENGNESYKKEKIEIEFDIGRVQTAATKPYLPSNNYKVSKEPTEQTLDDGLVITDGEREFVWIEVPNDGTGPSYPENATDLQIETALRDYCKDIISIGTKSDSRYTTTYGYTDSWYSECGIEQNEYETTKSIMLNSIKDNGGFYIGRYETGIDSSGIEGSTIAGLRTESGATTQKAVILPNVQPYTYVTCAQAENLARKIAPEGKNSSLLFGIQWDLVLKYLKVKGKILDKNILTSSSRDWGNYYTKTYNLTNLSAWYSKDNGANWTKGIYEKKQSESILLTTGAYSDFSKQNIYDLAGNVWEWTFEKSSYDNNPCASRGGSYKDNGSGGDTGPASFRSYGATNVSRNTVGFRVALY